MSTRRAFYLLLAALIALALALTASFGYAVRVSRESTKRDHALVLANHERSLQNAMRALRACESRDLLAKELLRLGSDNSLIEELNALNAKYPDIAPCEIGKEDR